ncbi:MAG TPA: hypothetical protein VFJ95_01745, partial [Gammaproteobacteria bacterium]|nr:hypothetical protein [Gammaproteobacteria bacterium]
MIATLGLKRAEIAARPVRGPLASLPSVSFSKLQNHDARSAPTGQFRTAALRFAASAALGRV